MALERSDKKPDVKFEIGGLGGYPTWRIQYDAEEQAWERTYDGVPDDPDPGRRCPHAVGVEVHPPQTYPSDPGLVEIPTTWTVPRAVIGFTVDFHTAAVCLDCILAAAGTLESPATVEVPTLTKIRQALTELNSAGTSRLKEAPAHGQL